MGTPLNPGSGVVQPAPGRIRRVGRGVADDPRHHKEFGADPVAVGFVEDGRRRRDAVFVQQILRQGLRAEVVVAEDSAAGGRNPDDVLACGAVHLGGEGQTLARPSGGAIGGGQFGDHHVAAESMLEPRLQLSTGGGEVALHERDADHAEQIYIDHVRCKGSRYLRLVCLM